MRRALTKAWKKEYFVLRNGFLLAYKTKEHMEKKRRYKQKLALYECSIQEYKGEKFQFSAFQIKTQLGKDIVLRANSEEDMLFWVNAILREKHDIEETINAIAN